MQYADLRLAKTFLGLDRCPHCNVDQPSLAYCAEATTVSLAQEKMAWRMYACGRCGKIVSARSGNFEAGIVEVFPEPRTVSDDLPNRARTYLYQATLSLQAPAGAVMLAASAVDAMLKEKGLTTGSLSSRINEAATKHLITQDMASWAHEVRLDSNDQRHSDLSAELPTSTDAQRCIDFAAALGQILFVLPARVQRGINAASSPTPAIAVASKESA